MSGQLEASETYTISHDMSNKSETLTYENMIEILEQKVQNLLKFDDFTMVNVTADLKFIQRHTRYSCDVVLNRRIVERIVRSGIAHVYLHAWHSLSMTDYLQDDDVAFTNLQLIVSIVWNCTDKSISLCDSLARAAVVHQLLAELSSSKLLDVDLTADSSCHYLVKAYLGILHNMVRLCADSRQIFRSAGAVTTLRAYLHRPQGLVRTKAFLILSYVVDERENDIINATDENIAYIVDILRSAVHSENHFSQTFAFWASEIICGLNHLAVNDLNKDRLGRLGAVQLYVQLLTEGNCEEQSLAAAGLWILSFCAPNRHALLNTPGCLQALQKAAAKSDDESVSRSARGALWVVGTVPDKIITPTTPAVSVSDYDVPHIMISYHWGSQKTMIVVKERLKAQGFKVWMDIDNMSGSTLEAMALAVERAAVVLVCLSQGYKDSPSCRTEAEYTYRLRKDIIPLVLQQGYVPDGWLGILVGTKLFFDLSLPTTLDTELGRLVREIGTRGRLSHGPLSAPTSAQVAVHNGSTSTAVLHSYQAARSSVAAWSQSDVQSWLSSIHLSQHSSRFTLFSGSLLLQYKKMMSSAPEYFYRSLEELFGTCNVTDILLFSQALDSLS